MNYRKVVFIDKPVTKKRKKEKSGRTSKKKKKKARHDRFIIVLKQLILAGLFASQF